MTAMKPLSLAMLLAPVVLGSLANDAGAQGAFRNVSLAINVASHKPNGAAWDAFGGAPDIAICINSALGQRCFAAGDAALTFPSQFGRGRCQDAFACGFNVVVPSTGPFTLTVYDVDLSEHDTIGACMIGPGAGVVACGSATVAVR